MRNVGIVEEVIHNLAPARFSGTVRRFMVPLMTTFHELHHINAGVFSRAEALARGETDRSLSAAVRDGLLVRLRRGMYVPADLYAACDDTGRHLLHARAAVASQRGRVALTGASAAALHGFAIYGSCLKNVHLVRLDSGSSRSAASVRHHVVGHDIDSDVAEYAGLLAISPARAVWEVACRHSLESGVVTADSALRQQPELALVLEDLAAQFARFPGSGHGRTAIRLADPRAASPGESVSRVQFYRFGIPKPDLQHKVYDAYGNLVGESDFYWEEFQHLGEFDGKVKYLKYLRPGESASDCVFREKRREDTMRAQSKGMSRFTWDMMMNPKVRRTMHDLQAALNQSKRLFVRRPAS